MSCSDYTKWIALKLEGDLPEGRFRLLEEHLSECKRCRAELLLQGKIYEALEEERHSGLSVDFTQAVSKKVFEIAKAEKRTRRWVEFVPAFALGAVAVAFFFFGADLLRALPSPTQLLSGAVFKPIGWFLESVAGSLGRAFGLSVESAGGLGWLTGSFAKALFLVLVASLPGVWGLHKIVVFLKE